MAAAKQVASARALGIAGRGPAVGWNGPRTVRAPRHNVPTDLKTREALRRLSVLVAAVEGISAPDAAELAKLREENAALRATIAHRLDAVDTAFLAEYNALRARAAALGERIPGLAGEPDEKVVVPEPETAAPAHAAPAVTAPDNVVVEADAEGAVVYKFNGVSNGGRASAMAVPKKGDKDDSAVVFTFGESEKKAAAESVAAAAAPAVAPTIPPAEADSGSSESESDTEGMLRRRKRTTAAATGSSSATAAPKPRAPRAKKVDPFAAARTAAEKEVAAANPATVLSGKDDWLYATVPAIPVAGAPVTLFFNRGVSDALRYSPKVQLLASFNNWELAGEEERLDMAQATGEWHAATLTVPADAYEMNFIFGDGEGVFDNADGANYCLPVSGAMTRESWIDTAPERAEAVYLARKAAEAAAAKKAAAEREAAALEADRAAAAAAVDEIKRCYKDWQAAGAASQRCKYDAVKGVLSYNPVGGPLADIPVPEDQTLTLKLGHNAWKGARDVTMKRAKGGWWEASLGSLPREAVVLNFVVQYYEHFDNNGGADFAVALPAPAANVAAWADALLPSLTAETTAARHAAEAATAAVEAARAQSRLAVRQKAEDVRRRQGRHVLFTEPAAPEAGKTVTIAYNPNSTVLHGAERVFLRGGFNRWRHPKAYGPIEMTPPADSAAASQHYTTTVTIPKDAYSLDFVFSDAEEGGRYDNAGGLDYQLPVTGSVVEEPPLYVVHVAAEMAPIAKVGGLGDVVTALGRAVQEVGHTVEVVLPRYDFFKQSPLLGGTQYETEFEWEGTRIFVSTCMVEGLRVWFIEPGNGMFATSTVYQGASDAAKFSFFSRAALEFLLRSGRQPDILHCHDWSTAEVAKAYWNGYHAYGLWRPKVVFTIHNLNYGAADIGDAAYFSQRFTTVSPSYAGEIGGHPAIAPHSAKLMGIRNGIDIDIWNPETDQFLPVGYTADNCAAGKAAAREELRRRVGLSSWGDKPLVGVVTRLTKQKGTHLIAHSAWRTLDRGGQFVLLGSAPDPKVQAEFNALAQRCGGDNAAFCFAFDEPLSHLIYAACDMILVPSMFEPCGLTQMIAMRYGAVPVVRSTGGLHDTVFDVDTDKARAAWEMEGSTNWVEDDVDATNGFAFEGTDEGALDYAMNRALDAWYNDKPWFESLQQRVMRQDWSWNRPALEYVQLYYAALK